MPQPDDASILPRLRNWFKEKLANGHFSAILAVADDKVIASSGLVVHEHPPGIMIPNGREAYINEHVHPPAMARPGIATVIFRQLLEVGEAEGLLARRACSICYCLVHLPPAF